ncbi:MAG: ABC transporter ATP-binding protein [Oscillospiraceae bacterium]
MLKINNLFVRYGSIEAVHGINLSVGDKTIVCLIGSNGAGKSSLLKAISGMVERSGLIEWDNENITSYNAAHITKLGIMHVPEGRQVFPGLTVFENLEAGCINWRGYFGKPDYANELTFVYDLFPILKQRSKQLAWSLSGGEQQMLAIGRALMGRPKILLLDEPSMGLAPLVIDELFEKITQINNNGLPILMVEQNARKALKVSDYAYIMSQGKIELEGAAQQLIHDDRVIATYFGKHWQQQSKQ